MQPPDPSSAAALAAIAAATLSALRTRSPRIHCITNTVAQAFTANVLLAAGAKPAMTASAEEVSAFVTRSNALLVNLGTLDRERREAIDIAIETAADQHLPWVLDPVFVDRVPFRATLARDLIGRGASALRLNAMEFQALADTEPSAQGVVHYARRHGAVVAMTGATDIVSDGRRRATVANGHSWMAKVTAMGCANSALVAACIAVEPDHWKATAAAVLIGGIAGEMAAENSQGPGTFAAAYIDAIHALDERSLNQRARVQ